VTITAKEASPPQAAKSRRRFRYTLPGAWVALVFACLAFTPSLLPRSALLQGVVCGISAAVGYGVGVAGAWTWRVFADRDPRPVRPGAWRVFAISAAVLLVVAIVLGQWWQAQLRDLMGAPTPNLLLLVLLPLARWPSSPAWSLCRGRCAGSTTGSPGGCGGGWDRGPPGPSAG
jgi:uncharacterized membrane protein